MLPTGYRPRIIRAKQISPGRYRVWATVNGRRLSRTYGPPPEGCRLPHAWAADQLGRSIGWAADSQPLWAAAKLPTLAFQAWA